MIDFDNQTNLKIKVEDIKEIAEFITNQPFELVIVDDETIKNLNKEYRNIDKVTDVLSFPLDIFCDEMPIGTIVINENKVKQKSEELNHSIIDEFKLLLIHGLLHLIGYDHEVDNGEMREKEKEIIEHFNLPKSLIIRNDV